MRNLLVLVIAFTLTFFGVTLYNDYRVSQETSFGATLPQAPAVFETSLQSPITSSATTMTLTANSVRGGDTLSGYNCFTIDEGSAQAEFVCGTVSGTSVTAMSRGIKPLTGTTTSSTLQFAHRRGANVKITDFPVIQILKAQANGQDTYPNILFYDSTSATCGVGTSNYAICGKAYIDGVAVAGASNANETTKGIVELATALENASSTATGSTGASLVAQSQFATDTPTRGCAVGYTGTAGAGCSVVAQLTGKLRQTWINLTETYTWTALHTFTGGITATATTTIPASSVTNNALILNSIAYKFPATQGASSTMLTTNGSGTLIWDTPSVYAICVDGTRHSVSGTTATTTAEYCVIPAGTLTTSANIEIYARLDNTLNAAYGEIQFGNGTATTSVASMPQRGKLTANIFATSTTAQGGFGESVTNASVLNTFETYTAYNTANRLYVQFDVRASNAGSGTADATGFRVRINRQ